MIAGMVSNAMPFVNILLYYFLIFLILLPTKKKVALTSLSFKISNQICINLVRSVIKG